MSWFTRNPKAQATHAFSVEQLERFGRLAIGPGTNPSDAWAVQFVIETSRWALSDASHFKERLVTDSPTSGWAALGAEKLYLEVLGAEQGDASFDEIMARGLGFLRSRGVPQNQLTGNEWSWWVDHANGREWLEGRPLPAPDIVPPLSESESRWIANTGPQANNNDIFVEQSGDEYVALIVSPGYRHQWLSAASLPQLYGYVGDAMQTPAHDMDEIFAQFIPFDTPDLT